MSNVSTVLKQVPSQMPTGECRIAFVFDFPTTDEQRLDSIMVGSAGKMFHALCEISEIDVENCLLTHALAQKPPQENPSHFFYNRNQYKAECKKGEWKSKYPVNGFGYLKKEFEHNIDRLCEQLNEVQPNIIVAMGSIALWALTGLDKVGTYRGTILKTTLPNLNSFKVIPTYSPSAINRQYEFRPIVLSDLEKAVRESNSKELTIKERELWIEPEIKDLEDFEQKYIRENNEDQPLSFDIETGGGFITCIGFAPSDTVAMVVPFKDERNVLKNYWTNVAHEQQAWSWVKEILENEKITKVAQNQFYDITWLAYKQNINVRGIVHDTMHCQHALQPEHPKALGFLGSIYTDEGAWKTMAKFSKSTKKDE